MGVMGVWRRSAGQPSVRIARVGGAAPDAPAGVVFAHLGTPVINALGDIAFTGYLQGPGIATGVNDFGVFATQGADLHLVARLGDPAPGVSDMVFRGIGESLTFNRQGQVAFLAGVGAASGAAAQPGIWATDANGLLRLIVTKGSQLDVENGPGVDLRTVSDVSMLQPELGGAGNEDELPSAFNERGQLAFIASFTNGTSGVFVSSAVAVPEPTDWVAAATAIGVLGARRRLA